MCSAKHRFVLGFVGCACDTGTSSVDVQALTWAASEGRCCPMCTAKPHCEMKLQGQTESLGWLLQEGGTGGRRMILVAGLLGVRKEAGPLGTDLGYKSHEIIKNKKSPPSAGLLGGQRDELGAAGQPFRSDFRFWWLQCMLQP